MTGRTWLRNAVDVALAGAIDQTDTTIVVDDATLLPDDTPFYIVIDPFNDAGREYVRVNTIDKGTDTLSDLDRNLEGTQSLVHADGSIVRLSWQSQHLDDAWEDQLGIYSRGRWRGVWADGTYEKNDMVIDGSILAIANKQTTDPAAPVPSGDTGWTVPDAPVWTPGVHSDYVVAGVRVQLTEIDDLFAIYRVRAWAPSISADVDYTIFSEDNLTGVLNQIVTFKGDRLDAPGWFTFIIPQTDVNFGDDFTLWLLTQNTAATTDYNHPWVYTGTSQNAADPGLGNWNRDNQQQVIRLNVEDDDGISRQSELAAVTPGTVIRTVSEADLNVYWQYEVLEVIDEIGWFTYLVSLDDTGSGGGPGTGQRCQVYFEVPVAAPSDYVTLTDEYLDNTKLTGLLQLGDGTPVESQDAHGIDLEAQAFTRSLDWDTMSTSGQSSGGSGAGGITEGQADALYLRLDAGNSPVVGKPTFAAGLVLGANLEAGGFRLTGLATPPTADTEASPKVYVDDQDAAHVADADPHPQYLEPSEADAVYLKLDASNDPITGALDITAPLTVFDNKILIHDSDLNFFLDTKFQANIQLAGQSRLAFQQSEARLRFIGQTGTVIGHLYDDKTNDLPGSLLGAYFFTQSGLTLLSSGNTIVFTTAIDTAALFPGGASQVPELLVVTEGFLRQNNQPAASFQARTSIAGTSRNYGYAIGATNAASSRSSAPIPNAVRVAATAASVTVEVSARSFGSNIVADLDLHVRVYAAPIGGNV